MPQPQNRKLENPGLVFGLMVPLMMVIINRSMFTVALPEIRAEFALQADVTAWMVTAYGLPFALFMPLYGRFGDALNKRLVLIGGVLIFGAGTVLAILSTSLPVFVTARVLQGIGSSGVTPLSLVIISDAHSPSTRGRALGTWNSIGPVCFMAGPTGAGLLIAAFGWRSMFLPVLLIGVAAVVVIVAAVSTARSGREGSLRDFDWPGALLLATLTIGFVFYMSSRPITGVPPLRDWRLLAPTVLAAVLFILREKRARSPFVPLRVFSYVNFGRAGLVAGLRMVSMGGIAVVTPLLLTDIHGLPPATIGVVLMIHAASLLVTMRLGGLLSDRLNAKWLVLAGATMQGSMMILLGLAGSALPLMIGGLVVHGLGSGIFLAPLHRTALDSIPRHEGGLAAGLYSMIRFAGVMIGSTLAGVVLQIGLERAPGGVDAYLGVFLVLGAFSILGAVLGLGLRSQSTAPAHS